MVDYKEAFTAEKKVFEILKRSKKLAKYKLELHTSDQYGIDIEATAPGYEEFAIEIESTQGNKWPSDAPYPVTWSKFSVPVRKRKFYERHTMALFVKVNKDLTRAAVIPMAYACSADIEGYDNQEDRHFNCNDFFVMFDSKHPALCFCKIGKLATVIDEQFIQLARMKRINAKYTDMRPTFEKKARRK